MGSNTFSGSTNPNGTFTVSYHYVDDGPGPGNGTPQDVQAITITGTATPMMGGGSPIPVTGSTSTTIHNLSPTAVFDVYNDSPLGGHRWFAAGTFQDVGLADKGTLDVDWGDNSPHFILTNLSVGNTFSQLHVYPADGSSPREQVIAGLDRFRELLGADPRLHANHTGQREGIYWGEARLDGLAGSGRMRRRCARKSFREPLDRAPFESGARRIRRYSGGRTSPCASRPDEWPHKDRRS